MQKHSSNKAIFPGAALNKAADPELEDDDGIPQEGLYSFPFAGRDGVGVIYIDAATLEEAEEIYKRNNP